MLLASPGHQQPWYRLCWTGIIRPWHVNVKWRIWYTTASKLPRCGLTRCNVKHIFNHFKLRTLLLCGPNTTIHIMVVSFSVSWFWCEFNQWAYSFGCLSTMIALLVWQYATNYRHTFFIVFSNTFNIYSSPYRSPFRVKPIVSDTEYISGSGSAIVLTCRIEYRVIFCMYWVKRLVRCDTLWFASPVIKISLNQMEDVISSINDE